MNKVAIAKIELPKIGVPVIGTPIIGYMNNKHESIKEPQILPEGYTQLDYIEGFLDNNNTNPTINTGIPVKKIGYRIKTRAKLHKICTIFGQTNTRNDIQGTYERYYVASTLGSSDNYIACGYYNSYYNDKTVVNFRDSEYEFDFELTNGRIHIGIGNWTFKDYTPTINYNPTVINTCKAMSGGKYYYMKIYDLETDELVRDFIPAQRNSDGEIGMFDLVTNKFYASENNAKYTGGKEQFMFLDWIANAGNCAIPITYSFNRGIEIDISNYNMTSDKNNSFSGLTINGIADENFRSFSFGLGVSTHYQGTYYNVSKPLDNERHILRRKINGGISIDEIHTDCPIATVGDEYFISMFWKNYNNKPNNVAYIPQSVKIHGIKIYDENTEELLAELQPALRKSDNKAGFYNLNTKEFYTSYTGSYVYDIKNPTYKFYDYIESDGNCLVN